MNWVLTLRTTISQEHAAPSLRTVKTEVLSFPEAATVVPTY
jgi:hypothetical protein